VISIFSDRARAGRTLIIFGDGSATRDFVYVGDVVRAIVAALGDAECRNRCSIVNVGTGTEITVKKLASTIVELCDGHSVIEHAPGRAGEILKSQAAVHRLRDQLGIVAKTKLVDGLRETLAGR
jgi:UDP-glucose 4-epimerase